MHQTKAVIDVDLLTFAEQQITIYGVETNTERAIPDFYDGMKPVGRRALWALSQLPKNQLVKSARIVGDALGKYHPHGDCLRGDTLVYTLDGQFHPIKDLVGSAPQEVLAFDPKRKRLVRTRAHSFRVGQTTQSYIRITLTDGSELNVTANHPLFSYSRGWVRADSVWNGEALATYSVPGPQVMDEMDETYELVLGVDAVTLDHPEDFYDFTVDVYENMLVATTSDTAPKTLAVVHNSSVYGALVTLATEPTPTVFGEGNWGTIFDPPAAYRYTNAKLTTYGMSAFHPVYTPVVDYVPSFDRKDKEPLVLAMLLPQLLFNGASGIGVGMRTSIPSFTPASVLQVMVSILEGEQLTAEDYASRLRFYSEYGGTPVKSKENFARAVAFFDSTKGSIEWQSKIETDEVKKTVRIVGYAPSLKMLPSDSAKTEQKERRDVVSMLRMLDSVANVSQVDGVSYCVQARRDLNVNEFRRLADKVRQMTTTRVSYEVYVTERKPVGDGKYEVAFSTLSIPQLMVKWLKRRVQLEKKSLDWRIAQVETELHKLNLQLCAADNREIIFQVLKSNAPNLEELLAKKLSISVEDAKYILDLQVRRLSGLSRSDVLEKIKDQKAKLNALKAKRKNPVGEVRDFLASAAESFAKYSVFAGTHQFDFKSVAHTTL